MGIRDKILEIDPLVIQQILDDLRHDGVYLYHVDHIPKTFFDYNLISPKMMEKVSCFSVAASGCEGDGRNYLFIAPHRVDENRKTNKIVTDLDPIVMVADLKTGAPAPSGCVRFHGDFDRRTADEIDGILPFHVAVAQLRNQIKTHKVSFKKADPRLAAAMHYMANVYRNKIG